MLLSTLLAFRRGIIRVLFSLAGLIAGLLLASWNYLHLAVALHRWVTSTVAAQAIAFLCILIGVTVIFSLIASMVRRTAKAVGLGFLDRLLGAAFGFVRGVLLAVALMMTLAAFLPGTNLTRGSVLSPWFLEAARTGSVLVPHRLQEQITAGARRLMEKRPMLLRQDALRY